MLDKIIKGLDDCKITLHELESAEKLFRFLADAIKETRVELEVTGYDSQLERLIREKRIIPAIKHFRTSRPGMGLKEAKDAVEALGERLGVRVNNSWNR
jgi:ribosomal protein L7/L12